MLQMRSISCHLILAIYSSSRLALELEYAGNTIGVFKVDSKAKERNEQCFIKERNAVFIIPNLVRAPHLHNLII